MRVGVNAQSLEEKRTGVGRYLLNILRHWPSKKTRFFLYFKKNVPPDAAKLASKTRVVSPPFLKSNFLYNHFFLPYYAAQDKVDFLFCPGYISPLWGPPVTLTIHDIIYEARPDLYDWPSQADKLILKKGSYWSARRAKLIFSPSQFTKKEIVSHYRISPQNIVVTPLGVENRFKPGKTSSGFETLKASWGLSSPYFLFLGDLSPRRLPKVMVESFYKLACVCPNFQLLLVGSLQGKKGLKKQITYYNKRLERKAIIWQGRVSEKYLVDLYRDAFAFVWISLYEGFGLPPLEAAACGTPVLASTTASLPEVLQHGALGVKNPRDVSEVSKKMLKIVKSKNLREKLIKLGLETSKQFSWKTCAQKTYNALLLYS